MWKFFMRKQEDRSLDDKKSHRRPLRVSDIATEIGDFSDLAKPDVALKFWLPETAAEALEDLSDSEDLSISEFLRQSFAIHCYGLYAFKIMLEKNPEIFREPSIRYSIAELKDEPGKKLAIRYRIPELGKNIIPIKVWIPQRMKSNLQSLADHVPLKLSTYVREITISRLFGNGMLPQRLELNKASPSLAANDWEEDKNVPWREVTADEYKKQHGGEIIKEWSDIT